MALQLSDLDELLQRVRNTHSRSYLKESIVSYRAGAYRAAIISTWNAVCIDIIEKIIELSLSGDSSAKPIEERLNGILPIDVGGMLEFEQGVLDIACDQLQLISEIEKSHLEQLKDDCNICAHSPFYRDGRHYSPSPELTRDYIVQAANCLLVLAPVKGKVVIKYLYGLVQEESFPEDEEKAFVLLSSDRYLGRVRNSSVRGLIVIFLERLFRDEEEITPSLLNRISCALSAISRMYPEVYSEVLTSKISKLLAEAGDTQLSRVFLFLIKCNDAWKKIERAVKIRLDELILNMDVDSLISHKIPDLSSINSDIHKALKERVEKLEYTEKRKLVESNPVVTLKKQAISIFVDSVSFGSAYRNGMYTVVPYVEFFDGDDIKYMFKGIFSNRAWNVNQILNAGRIDEVFCHLYRGTKNNIGRHGRVWREFYQKAHGEGHSYPNLKQLLVSDGELESTQDYEVDEDDKTPI